MDHELIGIPSANIHAYSHLYLIETGIREFLIDKLSACCGHRWWKERLPPDIVDKIMETRARLAGTAFSRYARFHPLHYVDFPDLSKIILRRDNWREVFSCSFQDQNHIAGMLKRLEPIRNDIAHNREVLPQDAEYVSMCFQEIELAIGNLVFQDLITRCTHTADLADKLHELAAEISDVFLKVKTISQIQPSDLWATVSGAWWFDEDFLQIPVRSIGEFYSIIQEYQSLPRRRGTGHEIGGWLQKVDFTAIKEAALDTVIRLEKKWS